jgi:D-amino-acid oxidase
VAARAGTDVLVIGAGVSGLTTAVQLAEAGLRVRVFARQPPQRTTSAAAGASWGPYMVRDPRVLRWSTMTLLALESIAKDEPAAGVRLVDGVEAAVAPVQPPAWAREVSGFRMCEPDELPDGYTVGWRYTIPVVDMPAYLGYLERRLAKTGVAVESVQVRSLVDVAEVAPVAVNCTGLGARRLVPDAGVTSVRGQLVVVGNPGIECFFQEHDEGEQMTYILPHGDHVVLGGTAVPGDGPSTHDPAMAEAILRRCARVEPRLASAVVRAHRVGFRPSREPVRVEWGADRRVFHNYGHGGAGLTLSWGCAHEVLSRVASAS